MSDTTTRISGKDLDNSLKELLATFTANPLNPHLHLFQGNLILEAAARRMDAIVHGCNCMHTMGAGIALAIASMFPEAKRADILTGYGTVDKLGSYSKATHVFDSLDYKLDILNAYTQFGIRNSNVPCVFRYDAFGQVIDKLNEEYAGKIVGMPWIGCGLAGGDKRKVLEILNNKVKTFECRIYEL